jgi:HD-GYP domain-containing protein (c-di-GMP phosphodiesterase class II)
MPSIHRTVLYRLLAAWVFISLLIGVTVSWLGMRKIDQQLVMLATVELKKFATANIALLKQPDAVHNALDLQPSPTIREHFISGEFQDRNRRKLAATINPLHSAMTLDVERVERQAAAAPLDQETRYRKFSANGQSWIRVLVPLSEAEGTGAGYFEGTFLVDPELMARLRDDLMVTLLVALTAVALTTLCLYPIILSLNRNVVRHSRDLLAGNIELMEVVGSAIAKRDSATSMHNYRVATYAVKLGEAIGLGHDQIRDLVAGAFLHDVGKIGICDSILLKPAELDPQESEVMRTHVALGVDILRKSNWLLRARAVVEYHHEKFDGSGYNKGLAGEEIPLIARIFAVVDVFDALTSVRPYKQAHSFADAIAVIERGSGSYFDPRLAKAFIAIAEPLYRESHDVSQAEVELRLQEMIRKYFFAGL